MMFGFFFVAIRLQHLNLKKRASEEKPLIVHMQYYNIVARGDIFSDFLLGTDYWLLVSENRMWVNLETKYYIILDMAIVIAQYITTFNFQCEYISYDFSFSFWN